MALPVSSDRQILELKKQQPETYVTSTADHENPHRRSSRATGTCSRPAPGRSLLGRRRVAGDGPEDPIRAPVVQAGPILDLSHDPISATAALISGTRPAPTKKLCCPSGSEWSLMSTPAARARSANFLESSVRIS